ncbi:hypothetical protein FIBSPDRAFT_803809 [Athelia psychrophila]|uniref:DUF6535 domain-containing protein n=1 Tax=Athelia psychrophila TaxID=1759441 RepID=A0A165WHB5_9AGAM|nr:hypothetical protein FIBSPDRAFT_803809 [Fibularhizoctonia sp. CBS 109695]
MPNSGDPESVPESLQGLEGAWQKQFQGDEGTRGFTSSENRVWSIYVNEATKVDGTLVESWKGDMDGILIFSGLFSAVVTAFITVGYGTLQPDATATTTAILVQISQQLASISNGTGEVLPYNSAESASFTPSGTSLSLNAFWFLSLILSLTCALMATLVQQWARQYLYGVRRRTDPEKRARVRAYLYEGVERFKVPLIVEAIPALLHTSVFLFFAGLVEFMFPINLTIALVILVAVATVGSAYLLATLVSALYLDCPYRTPLSFPCWRSLQALRLTVRKLSSLAHGGWSQWAHMHHGTLDDIREREATRRYSEALLVRDTRALQWTVNNLTENADFAPFAESIPALVENYYTLTVLEQMLSAPGSNLPERISHLLKGSLASEISSPWDPAADPMVLVSLRATFSTTQKIAWRPWRYCANQLTATFLPLLSLHRNPVIAHYAWCSSAIAKYRLTNDLVMPIEAVQSNVDIRKNTMALRALGGYTILDRIHTFPGGQMKADEPPSREQHETLQLCRTSILKDFCARLAAPESQRVDMLPHTEGGEVLRNTMEVIATVVYHPAYDSDDAYQWAFVQSLGDFISSASVADEEPKPDPPSPTSLSLPPSIVYYILNRFAVILTQRSGARREARRIWERYMAARPALGNFSRWFEEVGQALS